MMLILILIIIFLLYRQGFFSMQSEVVTKDLLTFKGFVEKIKLLLKSTK